MSLYICVHVILYLCSCHCICCVCDYVAIFISLYISFTFSSPKGRNHSMSGKASTVSPGGNFFGSPFSGSNGSKWRPSLSKPTSNGGGRGRGHGKKGGEVGYLGYVGTDDGFDSIDSPMSVDGGDAHQQLNGLNGEGMDEVSVMVFSSTIL